MKKERLFELIGQLDEKYIAEAEEKVTNKNSIKTKKVLKWTAGVAAAVLVSVILPNINGDIAKAMESIPVLGKYFQVVTFREYHYEDDHNTADVVVPKVEIEKDATDQEVNTAESMNKSIEEYAQKFVQEFQENLKAQGEGYQELNMNYEVVTDNEEWLTIKVSALQIEASGYEQVRFFHIDKKTGKEIVLSDLFVKDSNYVEIISKNIIEQMKEQMQSDENKRYFYEGDDDGIEIDEFKEIKEDQNFYFNSKGEIVIVFDEYEVAPGYMGTVEFTIPSECIESILK